jgi:hypothetical protein
VKSRVRRALERRHRRFQAAVPQSILAVPKEGLAYLKVDSKTFDRAKAESVVGTTVEPA